MYESRINFALTVFLIPALLGMLVASGCSTGHATSTKSTSDHTHSNLNNHTHDGEKSTSSNRKKSTGTKMYFPVDDNRDILKLERNVPKETRAGVEYPYNIKVTNVSDGPVHGIVVREFVNGNLEISRKNGKSGKNESKKGWHVGSLDAQESKTLNLVGLAKKEGTVSSCIEADFHSRHCSSLTVTDPKIQLTRTFVDEDGNEVSSVYACDEVYSHYRVKNIGSGNSDEVTVNENFNSGITTGNSSSSSFSSDKIAAGDTYEKKVRLNFDENGMYKGRATASHGNLSVKSNSGKLNVMEPELSLRVFGPRKEYIDRDVKHQVKVKNTSDDPAIDTFVKLNLPENVNRVSTSFSSSINDNGRVNIGRLEAGESRTFTVKFSPTKVSTLNTKVTAGAYCVKSKNKRIRTDVIGHPAIGMEVTDTLDPVKIGETTRYLINIKNQGSAADKNVRLEGILPKGTEFVRATGETEVSAEGSKVIFQVPGTMKPGQDFKWEVHVRATKPGSGYFTLKLNSNANSRAVTEEEPTNMVE